MLEQLDRPRSRRLTICGLGELGSYQDADVTHVLSILDPGFPEPADFASFKPHERLTLRFDDVIAPVVGFSPPQRHHIEALLAFGETLAAVADDPLSHLLVHCHAGISRSTASMAALLAQSRPDIDEDAVFVRVREIRPQAWPNSLMVEMADDMLGRDGRFLAALRRLHAEQMNRQPNLVDLIRRCGRERELQLAG